VLRSERDREREMRVQEDQMGYFTLYSKVQYSTVKVMRFSGLVV
jgi:hypothetical protein